MSIFLEILIIFLLILVNGFFSMSEIALISSRKVRLQQRAEEGDKGAAAALALTKSANRLLSSVQIGITLVGMFTGALGGATLANQLSIIMVKVPWLAPYASVAALVLVVLLTTYFSLVLGELIPKRLGMNNPEKIASRVAGFMTFISKISAPILNLLTNSTDLGLRILGASPNTEPSITEEEIKGLMEEGTQVGVFEETEQDMIEGVFRLNDRMINAIMTPRTEIEWLDLQDTSQVLLDEVMHSTHSRFPVADGSLDQVVGILNSKDLLEQHLTNQEFDLLVLVQKPLFVPENTPASRVLELVRQSGLHEALVIDEYGGLMGMVTLFDVLEAIVGELPAHDEPSEPEIVLRDDGSYLLDGLLPIDELKELFDLDDLPDEGKIGFQTLGGFIMNQLGHIPSSGQKFFYQGFSFEVMDMDARRVDKVLVTPSPEIKTDLHDQE
ncbi:MAG: hemolysin family protein [Anaerolineaceae bacterium]